MTTVLNPPDQATAPLVLIAHKDESARFVQERIRQGREIKLVRIRSREHLDAARQQKTYWVQQTTELLNQLFSDSSAADRFNDWTAEVLPEYAPLEAFIEAFFAEINHRLQRLKGILRHVTNVPEPEETPLPQSASSADDAPAAAASAPAVPRPSAPAAAPPAAPAPTAAPSANSPRPSPSAPTNAAVPAAPASHSATPRPEVRTQPAATRHKVLLVHAGGDETAAKAVAAFAAQLGLQLVDVPLGGSDDPRVLCERLDRQRDACFAIVHLGTHDPAGAAAAAPERYLLFVLGFAVGRFGAERVVLLSPAQSQLLAGQPGLSCIPFEASGGWQLNLARQVKRAGIQIDLNRLL